MCHTHGHTNMETHRHACSSAHAHVRTYPPQYMYYIHVLFIYSGSGASDLLHRCIHRVLRQGQHAAKYSADSIVTCQTEAWGCNPWKAAESLCTFAAGRNCCQGSLKLFQETLLLHNGNGIQIKAELSASSTLVNPVPVIQDTHAMKPF